MYSSQLSYADVTSHTTTNDVLGEDDFRLSGQQRRRTRKGFGIQASTRSEIKGAASVKLRISAATKVEKQRLYHVYVGKLKENTSKKAVLDHLHDIGVSHVSDVIQLHRKTGGQASFCVSVDNSDDEDAMYNPDTWPAGALIRPYKLRTQMTRNQQTTRDQRPARPRTHQEPRALSYRRQAAATGQLSTLVLETATTLEKHTTVTIRITLVLQTGQTSRGAELAFVRTVATIATDAICCWPASLPE